MTAHEHAASAPTMAGGPDGLHQPPAPSQPPGPHSAPWTWRVVFDGAFAGPLLPPPPPRPPAPAEQPQAPVTEAVLAIPLGTRQLVSTALDLLTRTDAGLRSASFYIGLMLLLTAGPAAVLFAIAWLTFGDELLGYAPDAGAWSAWFSLALLPAALGYLAASVDARALATAVIGGRAEGRPLRLTESIAVVRRRFWRVLGGRLVVGVLTSLATFAASWVSDAVLGPVDAVDFGISLVVGLLVSAPFVYVTAGIMLGEVGVVEAIRRSTRLVQARVQLAVVVALFGVLSQFIVLFGLGIGLDTVTRVASGVGIGGSFPPALAVLVTAALVFALGTLVFLVEAIAAAPAVYAFAALTHYTHGLELGRREPLRVRHAWEPWITPGLAVGATIALFALLAGIAALPG